jgi:hypothetical protein
LLRLTWKMSSVASSARSRIMDLVALAQAATGPPRHDFAAAGGGTS